MTEESVRAKIVCFCLSLLTWTKTHTVLRPGKAVETDRSFIDVKRGFLCFTYNLRVFLEEVFSSGSGFLSDVTGVLGVPPMGPGVRGSASGSLPPPGVQGGEKGRVSTPDVE